MLRKMSINRVIWMLQNAVSTNLSINFHFVSLLDLSKGKAILKDFFRVSVHTIDF
eukprot:m.22212 g.22212  ORF g.22212 m.22212 type:complete len:55 (+) comp13724_c0_seq1:736-900(+)